MFIVKKTRPAETAVWAYCEELEYAKREVDKFHEATGETFAVLDQNHLGEILYQNPAEQVVDGLQQ